MIRIEKVNMPEKHAKRYRVVDVSKAIGLSDDAVNGYFSNRGISTKAGLTMEQIAMVAVGKRRGPGINWDDVNEIRKKAVEYGFSVIKDEEEF